MPPPSNGKSQSANGQQGDQKPPKLPPRDFERKQKQSKQSSKKSSKNAPKDAEVENHYGGIGSNARHFGLRPFHRNPSSQLTTVRLVPFADDPYYSGFSARVPNYAKRQSSLPMPNQVPFKSTYNQQEFHARKVPSSGFLNSFLKTPNVIHSRTASYQSYYGSLGKLKRLSSARAG